MNFSWVSETCKFSCNKYLVTHTILWNCTYRHLQKRNLTEHTYAEKQSKSHKQSSISTLIALFLDVPLHSQHHISPLFSWDFYSIISCSWSWRRSLISLIDFLSSLNSQFNLNWGDEKESNRNTCTELNFV